MYYAFGNKYPINTKEQIKIANDYMKEYINHFDPVERVLIAANMTKRADDLNVNIDEDWIKTYSRPLKENASFSPEFEQKLEKRKHACEKEGVEKVTLNEKEVDANKFIDKLASMKEEYTPLETIQTLTEFDKAAGFYGKYEVDGDLINPISTVCESSINNEYDAIKLGSDDVTDYSLKRMRENESFMSELRNELGDVAENFKNKPVQTFENLSIGDQEFIAHLVRKYDE